MQSWDLTGGLAWECTDLAVHGVSSFFGSFIIFFDFYFTLGINS